MKRKTSPLAALFVVSSAMAASAGKFSAGFDGVKMSGASFDGSFQQNAAPILSVRAFVRFAEGYQRSPRRYRYRAISLSSAARPGESFSNGMLFNGASAVRLRLWNSVESVSLMWMSPVTYSFCLSLVSM